MKLQRKHIGQLFGLRSSDGSWVYQLVDVKKGWLLFYTFHAGEHSYYKERVNSHSDWIRFEPVNPWPKNWKEYGWLSAKDK
jgi:hypothetical protein